MNNKELLNSRWGYTVSPNELETFDDFCTWLEAILSGPCSISVIEDGTTFVMEQKGIVDRVKGLTIVINPKEHPPPHFHVKYSGNNVSFVIEDCSLLAGNIGNRELAIVRYWHKYSKLKLIEKWDETRPTNCTVGFIIKE